MGGGQPGHWKEGGKDEGNPPARGDRDQGQRAGSEVGELAGLLDSDGNTWFPGGRVSATSRLVAGLAEALASPAINAAISRPKICAGQNHEAHAHETRHAQPDDHPFWPVPVHEDPAVVARAAPDRLVTGYQQAELGTGDRRRVDDGSAQARRSS